MKNSLSSLQQNYYYLLHMQYLLFSVYFTVVLYSSLFLISRHFNIVSLPTQDVITAALLYLIFSHIFLISVFTKLHKIWKLLKY